jgi:hypothetical protein
MKQAKFGTSYVLMSPEGDSSGGGGDSSTSFDSVGDAVAELDRREQAREAERATAKEAKESAVLEADDEQPDTDSEPPDNEDYQDSEESDEVATDEPVDAPAEKKAKASLTEIEQDGKKYSVPAELKESFLRQSDYTRKTQELSSERAQVHAVYQQTTQLAQSIMQQQNQLAQYAQAMLGQPPGNDMIQTDPQGYLAQRAAYEQRMQQFQALMGQGQELSQHQEQLAAQQQAMQAQEFAKYRAAEETALAEHIPEMRDPAKKREIATRAVAVAQKYGFSPAEVVGVTDHRYVRVLKDMADMAAKLARYETADKDVHKRLANVAPRVQRPGTATTDGGKQDQSNAAKNQFMKSGRTMKDVARWARNST